MGELMAIDEQVLCIPAKLLEQIGGFTGFQARADRYLPAIMDRSNQCFLPRSQCESDPSYKQLIPYILLFYCQDGVDYLFQYTRGKGQGEKRLHALRSVGIGGHISTDDVVGDDWYRTGMERELREEIELEFQPDFNIVGLIYDPSNEVGQVHLGIAHLVELPGPIAKAKESGLEDSGFAKVSELRAERERLETWSRLCLDHLWPT
jgi:predicted NUDIX family phosphoesterase